MSSMHKVMGFGFPKLSKSVITYDGYLGNERNYSSHGFAEYLKSFGDERWRGDIQTLEDDRHDLTECIIYTTKCLCITPPTYFDSWHYVGDSFDKAAHGRGMMIEDLKYGIPHHHFLVDKKTGRKLSPASLHIFFDTYSKYQSETCDATRMTLEIELNEMANSLGYGTMVELLEMAVPYVPDIVRQFCNYLHLFRNADVSGTMHPLLCIYWR